MYIFNFLQFIINFHEKRGKVCSALVSLAKKKKTIYSILSSKLAPSVVYHGLIRALLSLALNSASSLVLSEVKIQKFDVLITRSQELNSIAFVGCW